MVESLSEKITLLNQTTLESLNEEDTLKIIKNFTDTGIKILGADFGFAWWKLGRNSNYQLAYKSPTTPYEPNFPRDRGGNYEAQVTKMPFYARRVRTEDYEPEYDVSPYMKSYCIIPIAYKNDIYGNIVICFTEEQAFSENDKSLYEALGNAAAQAITIHILFKSEQEAKAEAVAEKDRFQALIENSYDIISLISPEGEIVYISPSVNKISGFTPEVLMGSNIKEFIFEKDLEKVESQVQEILKAPKSVNTVEFRYMHKDASVRWMEAAMVYNPSLGNGNIVANIRDITESKLAQETILHQALHDTLTNLPNRKEFSIRLDQAIESAKRHNRMLAVMFLDLDRFKEVNDTLGHAMGDSLLKVVASRFSSCVRLEDTVARFGGDEFVILLNEIHSSKEAALVADKLLKATALPVQIGSHTFHPSVSIGISVFPNDGEDTETLKRHADAALYRAKDTGRNSYSLYDVSTDMHAEDKWELESELRTAIEEKQITVYYQPVISLKTGKVTAFEALARWNHPTKGLVLPEHFIPLAEETGLIVPLSRHVLREVCCQHKLWQEQGFPKFKVAVNFSAKVFADDEFISGLGDFMKELGCEPEVLEIEITESLAMGNLELTEFNLKHLKKMGVKITIDDFGTGYSSLSYLKRFPIHNLKIDRSFVRHCITDEHDAGITRAIISMAHGMNLKVVAEGVETDQQFNFLTGLGCDAAQGFYIAKPMKAEEVGKWLEDRGLKKIVPAKQMQLEITQT